MKISVKTTKPALISPNLQFGIVTIKNVLILDVLNAAAASYSLASVIESAVIKIINAWGKTQ